MAGSVVYCNVVLNLDVMFYSLKRSFYEWENIVMCTLSNERFQIKVTQLLAMQSQYLVRYLPWFDSNGLVWFDFGFVEKLNFSKFFSYKKFSKNLILI